MTDQTAYVNAYLENTTSMLHDQLNQIIQLKTQLKLTDSLLAQRDATITDLSNKLSVSTTIEKEMSVMIEKLRIAEDSHHALTNKVSHMETLQNQFNEVKKLLVKKEKELEQTKLLLEEKNTKKEPDTDIPVTTPKRKINKKKAEMTFDLPEVSTKESDDF